MKPIIKWAGGKTQLISRIKERMPMTYNNYYEPFIGGGALLFSLVADNASISDINKELVHMYKVVRDDLDTLIKVLDKIDQEHELELKEFYLSSRIRYNEKIKDKVYDVEMAALFIYLNKHCFNGLYRVNSKGFFNVPFNGRKTGQSYEINNLTEVSNYLKSVKIHHGDFSDILVDAKKGDFVFFDSPYDLLNDTSFESYTKSGFPKEEHIRLADTFKELSSQGVYCMLTNHNTDLINELYKDFNIEVVSVKRMINSDAKNRNGEEVIITNFSNEDV